MPNPVSYPTVPEPDQSPASLQASILRLKEGYELLTGQRGKAEYSLQEGLTQIQKRVGNASARMLELNELTVSANEALAQRTTIIEAEITDARAGQATLLARITQVDAARVSGDAAIASRTTTLESQMNSPTLANNTTWARVIAEEGTRATNDTAISNRTTTLEGQVNTPSTGILARLTTTESVAVSAAGNANTALIRYGVQGFINGITGGFVFTGVLKNDGTVSYDMEFNSNVIINGNLLINGSVNYQQVATNAITQIVTGQAAHSTCSVTITTRGGKVVIFANYEGRNSEYTSSASNSNPFLPTAYDFTLFRDGLQLTNQRNSYNNWYTYGGFFVSGAVLSFTSTVHTIGNQTLIMWEDHSVGPGTYVYNVTQGEGSNGGGLFMVAMEVLR